MDLTSVSAETTHGFSKKTFLPDQVAVRFTNLGDGRNTAWQVHAFCLRSNHFQFVVETPAPNLDYVYLNPVRAGLLRPEQMGISSKQVPIN